MTYTATNEPLPLPKKVWAYKFFKKNFRRDYRAYKSVTKGIVGRLTTKDMMRLVMRQEDLK